MKAEHIGTVEGKGKVRLGVGRRGVTITTRNGRISYVTHRTYLGILLDWIEEAVRKWVAPYWRGRR